MTISMAKIEYVTPAIEIVEFDAQESLLLGASNSTYDDEELSQKRRTNSIWGSSDGATSFGN